MNSVDRPVNASNADDAEVDATPADKLARLQGVARLGRTWLERTAAAEPKRGRLIGMCVLVEDLVRAGDHSPAAMTTARALLCSNCRRLDASEGRCLGTALHRCMLLNGPKPGSAIEVSERDSGFSPPAEPVPEDPHCPEPTRCLPRGSASLRRESPVLPATTLPEGH